jgi:Ala-tRNA(Pro) deacylase
MSIAQTLESYLVDRGASYTTEQHAASTSSMGTARTACIDETCLAKSVVLADERGFVLAVLPASRRLELGRVRQKLRRPLRICEEERIAGLFPDCALGAVPPVGCAYGLPTVLDASLQDRREIYFEAGDHETLVRMDGSDFLGLLATASVGDIASESANLAAAIAKRERFYAVQLAVRRALDAPSRDTARWRARLRDEIERLARATDEHVAQTEACEGILAEIVEQAPRLWRAVERLRRQHVELRSLCREVGERIEAESGSTAHIRRDVERLLARHEAHRHLGADLVFEAYGMDIGGG